MQTSVLKRFDAALTSPACWIAAFYPKEKPQPKDKALILRPGGMGDLICADIALQELGLNAADYTWVIETRSRPWARLRRLPHVCYDENPRKSLARVAGRFPLVINTEQRFGLAAAYGLLCRGKRGRMISFDTNRGASWAHERVSYDWKDRHETIEFARLFARAFDLPEPVGPRTSRARAVPASALPLVLIAGQQSPSRRLDSDAWAALISKWHGGNPFIIGGAPGDAELAAQLATRFEGLATHFTGGFDELCGQISRSERIFTMDGGAVHIASFYGVPTLALFTSGRDGKWHPLGEGSQIMRRHDLPCQPCTKFGQVPPCPNAHACLKLDDIAPENCSGGL